MHNFSLYIYFHYIFIYVYACYVLVISNVTVVDYIVKLYCGIVVVVIVSLIILLCNVIMSQLFIDCIPVH